MKSEEAVKELKENAQEICEWELDRLNIIEKDLKILEILKKYIYYSPKTRYIRMIDIYKRTTSFDYEELKEWIENELLLCKSKY